MIPVLPWGHTKLYCIFGAFSTAAGYQKDDSENRNSGTEGVVGKGSYWGTEIKYEEILNYVNENV